MRKKLTALILVATVPILFCMAWFMSNRSFSLSMEREKQRIQMTETIVFREVRDIMGSVSFTTAASYARQYHEYYLSQGIDLVFCWNGAAEHELRRTADRPAVRYAGYGQHTAAVCGGGAGE